MHLGQAAVRLLIQETCGDTVAERALDGDSDGESWSESEGLFSSDLREHDVESPALHVIGLNWSGEKVSFFLGGLGTCEGGLELPRCPEYVVPGNA